MLTLHQATDEIKTVLKWGGILVATVITVLLLFNGGKMIKNIFSPPKPPPPTVSFGQITGIDFPKNATDEKLNYTLDTLSGKLPVFGDRENVYEVVPLVPNLLASKRAEEKLSNIGFKSPGRPLSETLYLWENTIPPFKKITYDILALNFKFTSDFLNNQEVLSANNLPNENSSISLSQSFLSKIESLPKDIDDSKTKITLYSIKNSRLIPATSLSSAHIIRVDFYQKDVNKLPILYPNPPFSLINVSVASGGLDGQIIEANYSYNSISDKSATYPIKPTEQAFSELKDGKGYIASYYGSDKSILIKNVYLSYYMEEKPMKYLIPIIVFEGNNGFYGYVQAVTDEWVNK